MKKLFIIGVFLLFATTQSKALPPNWSVNPADYAYSMTVTGAINIGGMESVDQNDIIAAFVGDDCRGVIKPTYNSSVDRYIVYLLIYSNLTQEEITFKIYDASADEIREVTKTMDFTVNGIEGQIDIPYIFADPSGPTNMLPDDISIEESYPADTLAAVINAEDPDDSEHVYSLVAGNGDTDNGSFTISNDSLFINVNSDFETQEIYYIRVQANDGNGNIYQEEMSVNIIDLNDETPQMTEETISIDENTEIGTQIYSVIASDTDAGTVFSYSIPAEFPSEYFTVDAVSGAVMVADTIDFEEIETHNLYIQVYDNDELHSVTGIIVINVNDLNDEIPQVAETTITVSESAEVDFSAHNVGVSDADANSVFTYYFVSGNEENHFSINENTGEITVATALDFENITQYTFQIRVNDGANDAFGTFIFDILDENDEIPVITPATFDFSELTAIGDTVFTVEASDEDAETVFEFYITAGNESNIFAADTLGGFLTLKNLADYETETAYSLEITVSDGVNQSSETISVSILNENDELPVIESDNLTINENLPLETSVFQVTASDIDNLTQLEYSIISGNDGNTFAIDSVSGEILVNQTVDFETYTDYLLVIKVDDGVDIATAEITIEIADMNDEIPVFEDVTYTISEFAKVDDFIANLDATDADTGSELTFAILASDDNGVFNLNSDGELTLAELLDYEQTQFYEFTIEVSDGENVGNGKLRIEVIDVNEGEFYAFNTFSPNGDGINDYWEITDNEVFRNCSFTIYTNTGLVVYQSIGYDDSWDGTFNGEDLPIGVYYYHVQSPECPDCKFTGTISIIR